MKFDEEKKRSIIFYILEKINQGEPSVTKTVSEAFSVNQNTIHTYINSLVRDNIIERIKRGQYKLVSNEFVYEIKRSAGDLDNDTYAYSKCLHSHIENLESNVRQIWSYTFSEMINNVMDHSEAEKTEIVIEQDYLKTTAIISDNGIGIFNKIKSHFGFETVEDVICELFKGKLTTDTVNHSGEGIFFSSKMMDDFFIVSSGKIFSNNKYDNSRIIDIAAENQKGTSVIMSLSNFTHKIPGEIFDLYANVDGGFTKTRIPMKNIFDTAPVSRSQAKRVSNRLEKFKEVIIDFDNVQWMGQGFAHQLFVVFNNEHPDIKIMPVSMNEDVTKMYNHVVNTEIQS